MPPLAELRVCAILLLLPPSPTFQEPWFYRETSLDIFVSAIFHCRLKIVHLKEKLFSLLDNEICSAVFVWSSHSILIAVESRIWSPRLSGVRTYVQPREPGRHETNEKGRERSAVCDAMRGVRCARGARVLFGP
ncbi:hypothetical protein Tcan_01696, partial [Toxocara canis]